MRIQHSPSKHAICVVRKLTFNTDSIHSNIVENIGEENCNGIPVRMACKSTAVDEVQFLSSRDHWNNVLHCRRIRCSWLTIRKLQQHVVDDNVIAADIASSSSQTPWIPNFFLKKPKYSKKAFIHYTMHQLFPDEQVIILVRNLSLYFDLKLTCSCHVSKRHGQ